MKKNLLISLFILLPIIIFAQGKWKYSEEIDPIDDFKITTCYLESEAKTEKLFIKFTSEKLDLFIIFNEQYWIKPVGLETIFTKWRFDKEKAEEANWNIKVDGKGIFYKWGSIDFIKKLIKFEKLVIRVTTNSGSDITSTFLIGGIKINNQIENYLKSNLDKSSGIIGIWGVDVDELKNDPEIKKQMENAGALGNEILDMFKNMEIGITKDSVNMKFYVFGQSQTQAYKYKVASAAGNTITLEITEGEQKGQQQTVTIIDDKKIKMTGGSASVGELVLIRK